MSTHYVGTTICGKPVQIGDQATIVGVVTDVEEATPVSGALMSVTVKLLNSGNYVTVNAEDLYASQSL